MDFKFLWIFQDFQNQWFEDISPLSLRILNFYGFCKTNNSKRFHPYHYGFSKDFRILSCILQNFKFLTQILATDNATDAQHWDLISFLLECFKQKIQKVSTIRNKIPFSREFAQAAKYGSVRIYFRRRNFVLFIQFWIF